MRILYLGDDSEDRTSVHRARALVRLGHDVLHVNPQNAIPGSRAIAALNVRTGFRLFQSRVNRHILLAIEGRRFDLAWIDCGEQLGAAVHKVLKAMGAAIVNYNVDNPFCRRDRRKWDLYRRCVRFHDITVVVRKENVDEAKSFGANRVVRVFFSYDPVAHRSEGLPVSESGRHSAGVVFVGSWMPERGPLMVELRKRGVPLSILGDHWKKAKEWPLLRDVVRGPAVYGRDYVEAIRSGRVALGLVSAGNRDLHTTRSAEIPFVGGAAFCAQRTSEHEAMYREGKEAAFWRTPAECAEQCRRLLADEAERLSVVDAARRRVVSLGLSNDEVLAWILERLAGAEGRECYPESLCT